MSKPIQIATTHTRTKGEQWGQLNIFVLCSDGKIFRFEENGANTQWCELTGPWMGESFK